MKDNPNLTLELGSHTDSRGKSASNLDLSNKRAKSAVNYLIQKGDIIKSRIVSRGYGETILLNNCADGVKCAEEEHAINRRTELKIIGITDMKVVKSLAQMKKEEYMEEEILGLMDQEQVVAKNEEDLKRIIEADKQVIKQVQEQIDNKEKGEEIEISKDVIVFEDVEEEKEKIEDIKASQELEEAKEIELEKEEIEETETAGNASNGEVTDGTKVVLFQSKTPLPNDHFIFTRHQNVEQFDNGDGRTFYMIGGFNNESDAFNFLNSFIRSDKKYKGTFVANIKDGVLAVVNQ